MTESPGATNDTIFRFGPETFSSSEIGNIFWLLLAPVFTCLAVVFLFIVLHVVSKTPQAITKQVQRFQNHRKAHRSRINERVPVGEPISRSIVTTRNEERNLHQVPAKPARYDLKISAPESRNSE